MQSFVPLDPHETEEERKEAHKGLIQERQVEVFLQLDRDRRLESPISRERAMRGGLIKAIYYILAVLVFILYGTLF